ncbi:spermidine synthase [Denitratisoma sp. DHT3]|uniref:polyamine aminopropyltransferase n=1 Tax=Denitratisoma sp. DHT3 TaxID=1981880 RepID=UPI0011989A90|nr:polyamine aminopropyltransferase [Denitratisoma sp. DHT3]QDX82318.1 spermidine synthase [Denitratisoma sp. DHT3]
MQGLHLTADIHQCRGEPDLLVHEPRLAAICRSLTEAAGLTIVGEKWITFPAHQGQPGGVTGVLLLAESHLAIHTWPERAAVTLDVYACNFITDNSTKVEKLTHELIALFAPEETQIHRILRGAAESPAEGPLLLEHLNADSVHGYRADKCLEVRVTPYQRLEVFATPQFGRVLRIDDAFMTSEREEFFYHEALLHPAAIAHPRLRRALIIGGGDGGAAEELLKHPGIERVVVAELDAEVVEVAKKYFSEVHRDVFSDPRLEIRIGDGFGFVRDTDERFDLVVLDLTDPDTPATSLYSAAFFAMCRRVLKPGGALTLHLGSPVFDPERVRVIAGALHATFGIVRCYGLYIPLYGAYWGLAVASDSLDPLAIARDEVARRLRQRGIDDLRYYNADVHGALFALPNFYRNLLTEPGADNPACGTADKAVGS